MALTLLAAPPATRVDTVVDKLHGAAVRDPYRWLERSDSVEVQAWTRAQNRYLRRHLDEIPGRRWLAERLRRWQETGSLGAPVARGKDKSARLFYTRRAGKQNQPVLYVQRGRTGKDTVLLDVNRMAADGTLALDWWYPSEDGALVAYGISARGDENSTLRVREVATGRDRKDTIARARACSLAWLPDGSGFFYTRYPSKGAVPPGEEQYHRHVFFHRLGTDPAADPKVFGDELPLASWPNVAISPDGRWLGIEVSFGWSKSDIYLLDRRKDGPPLPVVRGRDAIFSLAKVLDDRLYVVSNEGAPRYQLLAVDPKQPAREHWRLILPEGEDTLESVAVARDKLAAVYLRDACSRVRVYDAAGKLVRDIALPTLGTASALRGRHDRRDIYLAFTSFLTPTKVLRHDMETGKTVLWRELVSPVDTSDFAVEQIRYTSKDGTSIPMFLVHKKKWVRDGKNPTLLYGYGGFNVSLTPAFAAWVGPFIERGGVYAVPNLRGGGEYGEAWHRAGMLSRKQNVFDDFAAAAEYLIAQRITSSERLAIAGASNGGLLVAASVVQHPELFKAAVASVPLADMVRYPRLQIARLWIPEYGSPDKPEEFAWLFAYSPYHHVRDGAAYPATLVLSAESDTRVDPMHARKFAARLQTATSGKAPILLRIEGKAGHGAGKPVTKLIEQYLDEFSFLFSELGIEAPRPEKEASL
ncbi:MAG: S9 family peptidase [Deltaproteobacteria bacterium]|nr:S9 family peptidase [Deltaproteobacteria bacterium]